MRVFITGGSGFLGKSAIRKILKDGCSVSALARSAASAQILENLGANPVLGNIENSKGFSSSLKNIDIAVHCASPVEFWGHWSKFEKGIINATLELANECINQGVRRFIYISSESVLQDKDGLVNIDETHPYPSEPNSFYGKAKKIAEKRLLALSDKIEILIIRPTFIWGSGCPAFLTLGEKAKSGQFIWVDQGRTLFEAVHVENVAEAVRLSLSHGKNQGIYFVTDDHESTVREFFESLFTALDFPIPKLSLPGLLLRPVASLLEVIWEAFRIKSTPPLTRFDLAFIAMPRKYKIERAKNELRYRPIIERSEGLRKLSLK